MNIVRSLKRISNIPWLAELLAFAAAIAYILQSWAYSVSRNSMVDEGAYLIKGYMFLTGQYTPYQDYGFWTNHVPLAFLIPGVIQFFFGPGLRPARYFAILLQIPLLLGVWLVARRLGGRWWATFAVLALAVNPALIKIYSMATSQGLTHFMFVWMLFFTLGERRPLWQIGLGSVLASMIALTRINMIPVVPLIILYIFWQHGMKAGVLASALGTVTLGIVHAIYWPGILRIWAYWLPEQVTPFLNAWRPPADAVRYWNPDVLIISKVISFFQSLQVNFISMFGIIAAWLLWPTRWIDQSKFRAAVFLSATFLSLCLVHLWATMANNYCVFCLPGYIAFFTSAGLFLAILILPVWREELSKSRQTFILGIIMFLCLGVGLGAFEELGRSITTTGISTPTQIENIKDILTNRFLLSNRVVNKVYAAVTGLGLGLLILALALGIKYLLVWKQTKTNAGGTIPTFGHIALVTLLVLGFILSPTRLLGGYPVYECDSDVISSYEAAGKHLARIIPPGSSVYWRGDSSAVPLLYIPEVKIFPPQVNWDFSYYIGGDSDALARYGLWNEDLAKAWVSQADFVLVQKKYFKGWLKSMVISEKYQKLASTPPTVYCEKKARILIYKR